jgi:hypothetical protein
MRRFLLLATAICVFPSLGDAQQALPGLPVPYCQFVSPPGGKAGTTVEMAVSGQNFDEAQELWFSHPGIKAERVPEPPPPPADPKKPAPPKMDKKGPLTVSKFKVTLPADVPLGGHDVRVVNQYGVSNPRVFYVGDQTEVLEKEPNNDVPEAQRLDVGTTVNGSVANGTDVDYYVFKAKPGQRVVISCLASTLDSRFKPLIEVFTAAGKPFASSRNYDDADALTDLVPTEEADYYIRLAYFTYTQGGPEHFYRLSVTTAPWIDAIVPPMLVPGQATPVTIYGRNLPGGKLDPASVVEGRPLETLSTTITAPANGQQLQYPGHVPPRMAGLDGFAFSLKGPGGASNAYFLTFARGPVVLENPANDTAETAQALTVPCEVAGRIEKAFDRDWYAFTAKKGDTFVIDAIADRAGTPTDLHLTIRTPDGKNLAEVDDGPPESVLSGLQFYTRSSDPAGLVFKAPADGKYTLLVHSQDSSNQYGPRHVYRLRVLPPQPDFRVVVMPTDCKTPDAVVLRADGREYFDVFVYRTDGFTGPVQLSAEGLPAGVTCPPQVVGTNMKQGALVLNAAGDAKPWTGVLTVKATATIDGKPVTRTARGATITWPTQGQNNVPALVRLDRAPVLAVRAKTLFRVTVGVETLTVKLGEKGTIPFKLERFSPDVKAVNVSSFTPMMNVNPNNLSPIALPAGSVSVNNNAPIVVAPDKNEGQATVDVKATTIPGTYSIVLRGIAQLPPPKEVMTKNKGNIEVVQPAQPVLLRVLPNTVGKLSVTAGGLKVGTNGEAVVRVERQFDYAGEFKLKFTLPNGTMGLTIADASIPAGQTEVKVPIKVEGSAKPGNVTNVVVTATVTLEGNVTLTHEAKFNLTIAK